MSNTTRPAFARVSTPAGCVLRRKELYEYTTPDEVYRVELYENPDGSWYAIAVPSQDERLIVYGTPVLPSAQQALQGLVDKIARESALLQRSTTPAPQPAAPSETPLADTGQRPPAADCNSSP
ncbi:MAG: hypothetical protein K6T31_02225 [Alicyclobacillus sp.]|nr:hypothetical protein [Alicyclobacillus sp.]